MLIFDILFFGILFILLYAYLVYPLIIYFWSSVKKKPHQKREWYPDVTLVIPFFDEDHMVEAKLENVKDLDYPEGKLQVLFVADGSRGRGPELIEKEPDDRIELIQLVEHRGKPAAVNEALRPARGEIVVFSDISGMMNKEAVKYIAENFYDKKVGAVLGIYRLVRDESSRLDRAEERYWDFELLLKKRESWIWSTLGGHGALYAVRKSLFEPLEKNLINDDFVIPARIALKGFRTVYEDRSVLWDRVSTGLSQELKRRIRIAYGNWQQMVMLGGKFRGFLLWQFLSHKAVRTVQGLFLGYLGLYSVFTRSLVPDVILISAGLVCTGGLMGLLSRRVKVLKGLNVFSFFLLGTWGQVAGSFYYFVKKEVSW